jgi:type IV secretion system protein VirB6
MGMATSLEVQLDAALKAYVTAASTSMTGYVASLAVGLTALYWLVFGLAAMRGDVNEPMSKITKDVVTMLLVAMVVFTFGNYQNFVIESLYGLVADLTSRMSGGKAESPGALIDAIFTHCVKPAGEAECIPVGTLFGLLAVKHANWMGIPDISFLIAHVVMLISEVVIVVLCLIPILLSKVALAIYLAIGPFFIMLAMFPQTRSYSSSWLSGALGNALTLVIVAGICSVVPAIMQKLINDGFKDSIAATNVLSLTVGILVAALGLGLTALKASQMGAQLAGGGVAMDGGNWMGALGNMYTNMKGRTSGDGNKDKDSKSPENSAQQKSPKSYAAGRTAGNVLAALAKKR